MHSNDFLAVDVGRGSRVESTHAVAACACTVDGEVTFARGEIDTPVYLRSAAKPFIAGAVVRSGAVERFGLEAHEIAVIAASHGGEPAHVDAVASILAKIGASEDDLQCGGPVPIRHNCSGKHAGILALARMLDAPLATYLELDHPAEVAILALCERAFREPLTPDRIGVDGCGIPVIAVSLRAAARGFARFASSRDLEPADRDALALVRDAMIAHPWFVAGTGRIDTDLMLAGGGSFVAKSGAEGVEAVGLPFAQTGLVVKVIDGAHRAAAPATIAILDRLGALDAVQRGALAAHAMPDVTNAAGRAVGRISVR